MIVNEKFDFFLESIKIVYYRVGFTEPATKFWPPNLQTCGTLSNLI